MEIEYDPNKNQRNITKRKLSFDLVRQFEFETAEIWKDDRYDYGEVRFCALGYIGPRICHLTFTYKGETIRVISLRRATKKRKENMPKLKPETILATDEEDREITRQAMEDGTLMTDEQLAQMKPISEFPELQFLVKRGRPRKKNPKRQLTIRLNREVVDFFKARGKGWQSEINDVLQKFVDSNSPTA